jgi:hypothetical protein
MREIATDAVSALQYIPRREVGTTGHVAIFDSVMHPFADRGNARQAILDVTELFPRKVRELVGITVATGQRVTQKIGWKFHRRKRRGFRQVVIIGRG